MRSKEKRHPDVWGKGGRKDEGSEGHTNKIIPVHLSLFYTGDLTPIAPKAE